MSPLDPPVPPVGEEIHLPGPSLLPILNAAGITLALIGITLGWVLCVVGGILFVGSALRFAGSEHSRSGFDWRQMECARRK